MAKAAKTTAKAADIVIFESTRDEPIQFDVSSIRGHRDQSGKKIVWEVPADRAKRFAEHHHVLSGRIRRLTPEPAKKPASEKSGTEKTDPPVQPEPPTALTPEPPTEPAPE